MSFNFMAAVTVYNDFYLKELKVKKYFGVISIAVVEIVGQKSVFWERLSVRKDQEENPRGHHCLKVS